MEDISDDYGYLIKGGTRYYSGNFLESRGPCRGGEKFQMMEKKSFFSKKVLSTPLLLSRRTKDITLSPVKTTARF